MLHSGVALNLIGASVIPKVNQTLLNGAARQKDSRAKLAAARNTLKSAWRPPKPIKILSDGRQIDPVYTKMTLAQGRITVNRKKIIPYSYCSWRKKMAFTFDEFEDFFQKKTYPSS
ncbi:hypothetical protein PoB_003285800 [Plakobranchus ocellatus]|uniref:Uncharacterized protein n=1 Tax=Plakobranchus ocellatus TaxID=259542 RepID=A0AAV4AGE9_9GAST|nr:hypothetical protein PoB_003285800 [Plakobranchus ocellatus]